MPIFTKKNIHLLYVISIIFLVIISIVWLIGNSLFTEEQSFEARLFQDIIIVGSIALATVFLFYLSILYKPSTSVGKVWLLLALGALGWTIGESTFSYYELFTDIEPFPSIADFFYLIAYIPLSMALILQMVHMDITLAKKEKIVIAIVYALICVFVIVTVIVIPIQQASPIPQSEVFAYFVGALYPILDLILILCVFVVFAKIRHGKVNTAWILLLIGILITTIADIIFNWVETLNVPEQLFYPYDLLFIISYVFILNSAWTMIYLMKQAFQKT